MKISDIMYALKVEGAAYWNPNTLEVFYYDPDYDEGDERYDRVDYPTLCWAEINFWNYDGDIYECLETLIDCDSDICRTEALGRIINEDGWIRMDSAESELMFWKKLGEFAAECVRKEEERERKYGK